MKLQESTNVPAISHGWGQVIYSETINYLIGRLLTLIEAIGLRESQEQSVKDLVRQEVWLAFKDSQHISPAINDAIMKFINQWQTDERAKSGYGVPLESCPENVEVSITLTKSK